MDGESGEYDYGKLKDAGKASRDALKHAVSLIKSGALLSDIADSIEKFVRDAGFGMAFPVNLSTGAEAAHYTPEFSDLRVVGEKDVIKIDLGARSGAYLTDCAQTVSLDPSYAKLVEASEKALENAISLVKSGRKINEIGREIEKTAKSFGFNPIRNLGGHGITQEELHADIFIPNFDNGDTTELEEGQVIAIEPFMTTGTGYVTNGESLQIFQKIGDTMPRSPDSRNVLNYITENFSTYPFALRWLIKGMEGNEFKARRGIADLLNAEDLEAFPVLVEKSNGIVSQAEKTLIVDKDSCTTVT